MSSKGLAVAAASLAAAGILAWKAFASAASEKNSRRRPRFVVGIDLGATNAKAGVMDDAGKLVASATSPLVAAAGGDGGVVDSHSPEAVVAALVACTRAAVAQAGLDLRGDVAAVGVGSPGHILGGVVKAAANFPAWRDVPLAMLLGAALGKPVRLVNDADAALLAEVWVGAAAAKGGSVLGRGAPDDVVLVTLGSGVGVAVLAGGALLRGSRGLIEGGHTIVHLGASASDVLLPDVGGGGRAGRAAEPRECGCGQRGCIEAYVSANSVRRRFHEARLQKRLLSPVKGGGGSEADFEAREAREAAMGAADIYALAETYASGASSRAAASGDGGGCSAAAADPLATLAAAVTETTAECLAALVVNLCRAYDPSVVLLGGGMAAAPDSVLLDPLRRKFEAARWTCLPDHVVIARAELGAEAGLVGAAATVRFFLQSGEGR